MLPKLLQTNPDQLRIQHGVATKMRRWFCKIRTFCWDPSYLAESLTGAAQFGRILQFDLSRPRPELPRLGRKVGIEKWVHAHGLRHTHASELRQEGIDVGIISKQLGHSSIATTARYLDHVAPQAVIDTMRARVWEPTTG